MNSKRFLLAVSIGSFIGLYPILAGSNGKPNEFIDYLGVVITGLLMLAVVGINAGAYLFPVRRSQGFSPLVSGVRQQNSRAPLSAVRYTDS